MTLRYLALGDSYTIGEGVAPDERWPALLAAQLRAEGRPIGDPEIIAATGWTTDELAAAIHHAAPRGPYDLVSLLIGVNNQYRGRSVEEYRGEFAALLSRAVELAGDRPGRVLVLSIPDWGVTPFAAGRDRAAIAAEVDRFNAVAESETGWAGARWVDVTGLSRGDAREVVADGLHPSGPAYRAWVAAALPAARAALPLA